MNFSSPRLQALLQAVGQPPWIAAAISVGFHGILFASGVSFASLDGETLGSGGGSDPVEVPLIELTPDEQAKLPAFTRPDITDPALSGLGNGDLGSFGQAFPDRLSGSGQDDSDSLENLPGPFSSPMQIFNPPPFRS
ncbi:hypothetical protein C7271_18610, partial [filamentous cyanobacterium CCP5]